MKTCIAHVLMLCWLIPTGCAIVKPQPAWYENHGRHISPADVAFIHPGQTTRAEVISALGTNYVSLVGDATMAYSWEVRGLAFDWLKGGFPGPYTRLNHVSSPFGAGWRGYFLDCDDRDVVMHVQFMQLDHRPLHEQLEQWHARLHPPPSRQP